MDVVDQSAEFAAFSATGYIIALVVVLIFLVSGYFIYRRVRARPDAVERASDGTPGTSDTWSLVDEIAKIERRQSQLVNADNKI